jgi:hypothetical protein
MRWRILVAGLLVLSAAVAVLAVLLWTGNQRWQGVAAIQDENDRVRLRNGALHDSLGRLARDLSQARWMTSFWQERTGMARQEQGMLLDEFDIESLKKMGLKDPVHDLPRDLVAHPELIPYEGVLGGTMGFYESSVSLLSTRWAFAYFEDGHIGGRCLLEYEVEPGGRISWKILAAMRD